MKNHKKNSLMMRIQQYAQVVTIVVIMLISLNGMWLEDNTASIDSIYTCLFCLSLVMLVDREDPK